MYPLQMTCSACGFVGHAVANTEDEHRALSAAGYHPPLETLGQTLESVRAQLDAAGVPYDKRLGLSKLIDLLPA